MQTMMRWTAAASLALTMGTATLDAQQTSTWRWNGTLADGRTVYVHNVNGAVRFEAGNGDHVEVEAEKRWRRGDPDDVRIEARQTASGDVVICAMWRRGDTCSESGIDGGERRWNQDNNVSVHFVVRVPAYANVEANSVNGNVEVAELRGRVEARTVNGSIRAKGQVGRDGLDYETVNGSIEIELPANADVNVSLRTTNGRVTSDFPITFSGEINPRRIEAKVGNGGPELRARTVNGGIRLRKQ